MTAYKPNWVYVGDWHGEAQYYDATAPVSRNQQQTEQWAMLRYNPAAIPFPDEVACKVCGFFNVNHPRAKESLWSRGVKLKSQAESVIGCVLSNTEYVNSMSASHHEQSKTKDRIIRIA